MKLPTITELRALSPQELEAKRAYLEAERDAWLRYADDLEERIRKDQAKLDAVNYEIVDLNDCIHHCIHWAWMRNGQEG